MLYVLYILGWKPATCLLLADPDDCLTVQRGENSFHPAENQSTRVGCVRVVRLLNGRYRVQAISAVKLCTALSATVNLNDLNLSPGFRAVCLAWAIRGCFAVSQPGGLPCFVSSL